MYMTFNKLLQSPLHLQSSVHGSGAHLLLQFPVYPFVQLHLISSRNPSDAWGKFVQYGKVSGFHPKFMYGGTSMTGMIAPKRNRPSKQLF